ncbi:uncharacterized protein QC763_512665 [Podospora pseudopauciseta]|uniref:Uncharacterized protein n=1 Tax=Podospora pseudopauciseta TaxID=2093780 RepID=A0ABR0H838_9PEZI|nr:hypothetical protein QC763_512665 [Podospora pseudopauciseta]
MSDISTQPSPRGPSSIVSNPGSRPKRQFADQIRSFADRTPEGYLVPGRHFGPLSELLDTSLQQNGPNTSTGQTSASSPSLSQGPGNLHMAFTPIYLVHPENDSVPNPFHHVAINIRDELDQILSQRQNLGPNSNLLVFLHGWQSPTSLRLLGAYCGLDPEMFRCHLSFLASTKLFDQPPLPSQQLSIWRIRTVTICEFRLPGDALDAEELERRRQSAQRDVQRYLQRLGSTTDEGTPIIRHYSVIDSTTSVLEQDISFCVSKKDDGWIGTIWTDSGFPLECDKALVQRTESANAQAERQESYVPLVLHRPKIAISPPELPANPPPAISSQPQTPFYPATLPPYPNFFHLASQYGSSLDPNLARRDALYAFSELISMAASSEHQLLNLLKYHIDIALHRFQGIENWSLAHLKHLTALVERAIDESKRVVYLLENEGYTQWPSAHKDRAAVTRVGSNLRSGGSGGVGNGYSESRNPIDMHDTRERTRKLLLDDYRSILHRAQSIKKAVDSGMAVITTEIRMQEARRSTEQAHKIGRITVLAYFFLPLSFVTSIYGMNFIEFKDDNMWKGIAAYVGTTVGILIPSMVLCFWKTAWLRGSQRDESGWEGGQS